MTLDEYNAQLAAYNQRSTEAKIVADDDHQPALIRAKALEVMSECLLGTMDLLWRAMNGEVRPAQETSARFPARGA